MVSSQERFLRSIACNPSLRNHVKKITWDNNTSNPVFASYGRISDLDRDLISQRLKHTGDYGNHLASKFTSKEFRRSRIDSETYLEAMMAFTPRMELLKVDEAWTWDDHVYWFNCVHFKDPHPFSNLTEANVRGPLRIQNVAPLIFHEPMRKLTLWQVLIMRREESGFEWEMLGERSEMGFGAEFENQKSNIEHFHMEASFLSSEHVAAIIGVFKTLRSFTFEYETSELSARDDLALHHSDIISALLPHRESLSFLRYVSEHVFGGPVDTSGFASLTFLQLNCYTMLRTIGFYNGQGVISNSDVRLMPPNLNSLGVEFGVMETQVVDGSDEIACLEILKTAQDLKIKEVNMIGSNNNILATERWPWETERIEKAFRDAGVKLIPVLRNEGNM